MCASTGLRHGGFAAVVDGHPTGESFGIAALTSTVTEPDGSELVTYSLATREAIGEAPNVHDRMPLVLPPDQHDAWLDPDRPGDHDLAARAVSWFDEISLEVSSSPESTTLRNPATLF